MNIRLNTLWRVPVFCLAASWVTYHLTIYMGWFFIVKTTGPDGVVNLSTDPVRTAIWHMAMFLLVLLVGGLWAFQSMTKAEIAASAAIAIAVKLALSAWLQTDDVQAGIPLALTLIKLLNWFSDFSVLLYWPGQNPEVSSLLSSLAPLLFIPFGRKTVRQTSPA